MILPVAAAVDQVVTPARSYMSDFTIGIVSGAVTGILIYAFSMVWRRVLVPWYEERLYRGIDVSGQWLISHPGTEGQAEWSHRGTLSLKQSAHRLTGSLSLVAREGTTAEGRTLSFVGEVSDRFVWGRLRHTSRARIGQVVMLAQITGDGRKILGRQ